MPRELELTFYYVNFELEGAGNRRARNSVGKFDGLKFLDEIEKTAGWECQKTPFYSKEKMLRMKRCMKDVPNSMLTAKLGTMPIQTHTHSAQKITWRSIMPSLRNGYCVAVHWLSIFPQWLQWFHSKENSNVLKVLSSYS